MKALIKHKPEPGIWLEETSSPQVGPNDVLIKVSKTAICGTDMHIYNWDQWAQQTIPIPLVIGHEFVGVAVEVGSEVKNIKVGDRVSGEGHIACGYCRNCRSGRSHICRVNVSTGVTRPGCFAEYLSFPAANTYPLPFDISDEQAAILDPLGNATHTALSFNLVGEDVLITGAGPVGLMAAAIARHVGARHVVITDVNDYRLSLAKKMGVTLAINSNDVSLKDVMSELHMREGFDVGLEMSGNPQAFQNMLAHMNHGGKIALLGFLPRETMIDWRLIIMKGLQLKGIYGREMFETWYKMICMLQGGLDISAIITHQFSAEKHLEAFETIRSGQCGKVVLNWN